MKFFVVGLDQDATREQRDAFTEYLRGTGAGFWHDVSHTWLIRDKPQGALTATLLRDKLRELMPGVVAIVVEASPAYYAAFSRRSGHEWLDKYAVER